jgi:galactokinase/mevalonate kinase-like predicted kinase
LFFVYVANEVVLSGGILMGQEEIGSAVKSPAWLVSLPFCMQDAVSRGACRLPDGVQSGSDPVGYPLGSGGGTVHLLQTAAQAAGVPLSAWLQQNCSVVLHGGGQSRRLPAYAAVGKPFVPVPVFRWAAGQRLDQTLFDLQRAFVESLLVKASAETKLVIASGDVLLQSHAEIPDLPDADVVMVGMHARPEDACRFGVLFCERSDPSRLRFFLQKPTADEIRRHSEQYCYFVDCGLWLLRQNAVDALCAACGCDGSGSVNPFDLYGEWGPCFGETPQRGNAAVNALTVAVAAVPDGAFYHFGRTMDVIDAVYELQNPARVTGPLQTRYHAPHPRQFVQNARFAHPLGLDQQACIWIENASVPSSWTIRDHHMITNIPDNDWSVSLPSNICLDMPPLRDGGRALRLYGMDDSFRGKLSDQNTVWLGVPLVSWLAARGLCFEDAGLDPGADMLDAAVFPVLDDVSEVPVLIAWMLDAAGNDVARARWLGLPRVSAADLLARVDAGALVAEQRARMHAILPVLARRYSDNMFFRLDLMHFGKCWVDAGLSPDLLPSMSPAMPALQRMHGQMLQAQVEMLCGNGERAREAELRAFGTLREDILQPVWERKVYPACQLLEDQIVWGRSPVRLDLAGGWTDTPPYCIENGGSVLNVAVNLNGQPPIQVFGRLLKEPKLIIRSIDLGLSEELLTFADVDGYQELGSGFAVARAAFALAGFSPAFCGERHDSLESQLLGFGGGIELSMLAAVPKGSGLGTSSILAATLLGVLSDLGGLHWDKPEISRRTLALEQMLTSGGGWQDQVGGIYGGVKLIETNPGLGQEPVLRWAPASFFDQPEMQSCMMLYYTGITRVAQSILGEIVRGLFLNRREHIDVIGKIGLHARHFYQLLLQHDAKSFAAGLRESWRLNQQLDAGTNVPAIAGMIAACGSALAGCKLTGAGGGGFLLMQAKDPEAARWIRKHLAQSPLNSRSRFVDWTVSHDGLQITRS